MTKESLIDAMKNCKQFDNQTVYEHGQAVQNIFIDLYNQNYKNYLVPDWFKDNFLKIRNLLIDYGKILEYTLLHDIGKPSCLEIKDNIRHFPNHARVSYELYSKYWNDNDVAYCILHDMDIHLIKDKEIDNFINKYTITLLFVGLAEILANAEYFGGHDSISFKIKYKQIYKRGKAILAKMQI